MREIIKNFWIYFLKKLDCSRGEMAADIDDPPDADLPPEDADGTPDGTFLTDDLPDTDGDPPDDDPDKKKKDDPPPKDDIPGDFKSRFEDLEKNYQKASKHIDDLNDSMRKLRRENIELKKEKGGDGEPVFTKAEIAKIINDNKDDMGILVEAIDQLVKQGVKDVSKITDKKVEIASKRGEVDSVMNGWKGYIEKNQDTIDKVVNYHDLGEHPFKEHLALGALLVQQWPKLVESIKDQAKQEALNGKADAARKTTIKNNKPDTGGEDAKPGGGEIKASWEETADSLGFKGKKRERYLKFMQESSSKKGSY